MRTTHNNLCRVRTPEQQRAFRTGAEFAAKSGEVFMRSIAARFAVGAAVAMATPAVAVELWLAPGKSVTIFDAADPSVRLVITAPPNAPLDLAPLLDLKRDESVHSIATRMQVRSASGITLGAD